MALTCGQKAHIQSQVDIFGFHLRAIPIDVGSDRPVAVQMAPQKIAKELVRNGHLADGVSLALCDSYTNEPFVEKPIPKDELVAHCASISPRMFVDTVSSLQY